MHRTWITLLVAALAVVPWLNGLNVDELAWEGDYLVGDNPLLDSSEVWTRAFSEPWAAGVGHALGEAKNRGYYRPIATLDLALERRLWGDDPRGWRVGALLLHGGLAAALLGVLEVAAAGPVVGPVLALAFAWHPLHSEVLGSVAYRTTALTALLGLLALGLLARRRGRDPARLAVAFTLALAAFLTKESALTFVVVIPLGLLALDAGPAARRRAGHAALGLAALAGFCWLARSRVVEAAPGAILGYLDVFERMALMTKAAALHARIIVWPGALNPHYDISLFYPPLVDWRTLAGLAVISVGGAVTAVGLLRRRPWAFALLAALATLGPISGIIPLRVLAADRFLVLPLALGSLAAVLAWRDHGRPWPGAGYRRIAAAVAVLLVLAALGGRSWTRMDDWRCFRGLMEARVRDFPESLDAQFGLGGTCFAAGELDCAREHLDAALEIYPGFPSAVELREEIRAAQTPPPPFGHLPRGGGGVP